MTILTSAVTVAVVMCTLGFYAFYKLLCATMVGIRFREPNVVVLRQVLAQLRRGSKLEVDVKAGWIHKVWTKSSQDFNAFTQQVYDLRQLLKSHHEALTLLPQQGMQGGILFTFAGFMMQADFSNPMAVIGVAIGSSLQGTLISFGLLNVSPWFDRPLLDRIEECERVLEALDEWEFSRKPAPCSTKRRSEHPRWKTSVFAAPPAERRLAETDELPSRDNGQGVDHA